MTRRTTKTIAMATTTKTSSNMKMTMATMETMATMATMATIVALTAIGEQQDSCDVSSHGDGQRRRQQKNNY